MYRYSQKGAPSFEISDELGRFTDYLIDQYTHDQIADPHERYHAYHLLIRLSRLYFGYAFESQAHKNQVNDRLVACKKPFQESWFPSR